ncbi:MAG: cysteine--tRNA ligase, partial [Bacteroidales bacterium]|nr:cysteine--tRNA ligase [Candidatus Equibacterium intestinale]
YEDIYGALCDDLNTPVALSYIFETIGIVNKIKDKQLKANAADCIMLRKIFTDVMEDILGIKEEGGENGASQEIIGKLVEMVLEERKAAKAAKDWAKSDAIRDTLKSIGIAIKDTKDGCEWSIE